MGAVARKRAVIEARMQLTPMKDAEKAGITKMLPEAIHGPALRVAHGRQFHFVFPDHAWNTSDDVCGSPQFFHRRMLFIEDP